RRCGLVVKPEGRVPNASLSLLEVAAVLFHGVLTRYSRKKGRKYKGSVLPHFSPIPPFFSFLRSPPTKFSCYELPCRGDKRVRGRGRECSQYLLRCCLLGRVFLHRLLLLRYRPRRLGFDTEGSGFPKLEAGFYLEGGVCWIVLKWRSGVFRREISFHLFSCCATFENCNMETLVAVARHRNYGSRGKSQVSDGFIYSPSRGFRGINCRTFQSGVGILPAPSDGLASFVSPRPTKQRSSPFNSEPPKQARRSSPINISPRPLRKGASLNDDLYDSERWAGPAYSNSPPPSSLPMPKFSLRQKRSVSLELSITDFGIETLAHARSAPPSPSRDSRSSPTDFLFNIDSATQDLRRILHLDVTDD
ncbi:hypothetical protein Taro_026369, partial [Colocasia esculenta]|nr:hypothetical protein [Colocasia esculenta]